jgi:hypothetical protein
MDMGGHNAKVHQLKAIFFPGIRQYHNHNFLTQPPFKNPELIVRP